MHVVEVTQLPCRWPSSVVACLEVLHGWRPSKEAFQVAGEQFAPCRVLVGGAKHRVSALAALGEDLGERRLAIPPVNAVEGGLLPAMLGSGLAGRHKRFMLDGVILGKKDKIFFGCICYICDDRKLKIVKKNLNFCGKQLLCISHFIFDLFCIR